MAHAVRAGLILGVLVMLVAACGGDYPPPIQPPGPSSERVTLRPAGTVDEAPLGYVEYLPPGYGDGKPRPLPVFLHGAGETATAARPRSTSSSNSGSRCSSRTTSGPRTARSSC